MSNKSKSKNVIINLETKKDADIFSKDEVHIRCLFLKGVIKGGVVVVKLRLSKMFIPLNSTAIK